MVARPASLWIDIYAVTSMTITVNIHEAKTHLSRLLQRVIAGEEVIIAKSGRPVARLIPVLPESGERTPGTAKGKIWISPDFNAPMSADLLESFEGE